MSVHMSRNQKYIYIYIYIYIYKYIYIYIEVRGFPARGILSLRTLDWGSTPQKGLFRVRLLDMFDDFSDLGLRKMILRCREHVWL